MYTAAAAMDVHRGYVHKSRAISRDLRFGTSGQWPYRTAKVDCNKLAEIYVMKTQTNTELVVEVNKTISITFHV